MGLFLALDQLRFHTRFIGRMLSIEDSAWIFLGRIISWCHFFFSHHAFSIFICRGYTTFNRMWTTTVSYLSYWPAWYESGGGRYYAASHIVAAQVTSLERTVLYSYHTMIRILDGGLTHTIKMLPGLGTSGHVSWKLFSRWPDGISIFGKSAVLQKAWCHCYYHRLQWQILYVARGLIMKRSHNFGLEQVHPSSMNIAIMGVGSISFWSFRHHHHNKHRFCAATRPT